MMLKHDPLTPQIIGAAIKVHSALGPGLLEKAYERCLVHKLRADGFDVATQIPVPIRFEGLLIVVTYLKLSKLRYGLLLNFNCARLTDGIKRVLND